MSRICRFTMSAFCFLAATSFLLHNVIKAIPQQIILMYAVQEIQLSGLKVLSTLVLTSDSISSALLTPDLLDKLQGLIINSKIESVRHLGLEVLGNLSFPAANKSRVFSIPGLLTVLIDLADGSNSLGDTLTATYAKRVLAILGSYKASFFQGCKLI